MMKNKNLAILLSLAALIILALAGSLLLPKTVPVIQRDVNELDITFEPSSAMPHRHAGGLIHLPSAGAEDSPEDQAAEPLSDEEVRAFLLITVGGVTYSPYPLRQSGNFTIRQQDDSRVNIVHVTTDSVTMASSTCDNQLCVGEGTVTLDNKDTRILGGYIICLPNEVTLQLLSAEELTSLLAAQPAR